MRVTWQSIRDAVRRRIHKGEWPPGSVIPKEADLAEEFGCSRATVNRALQNLADQGIIQRRRRAGSIVAPEPSAQARIQIPLLRNEIIDAGYRPSYRLLHQELQPLPGDVARTLGDTSAARHLHLIAIYFADDHPACCEQRWINLSTLPHARDISFETVSANEWLLSETSYTGGHVTCHAEAADAVISQRLEVPTETPLFVQTRQTWHHRGWLTHVTLHHAPGYKMVLDL